MDMTIKPMTPGTDPISEDETDSARQTIDGGYIVAGYYESNDGDVSGNHGNGDFWVIKLDSAGN